LVMAESPNQRIYRLSFATYLIPPPVSRNPLSLPPPKKSQ
jgi:hypothetical protein